MPTEGSHQAKEKDGDYLAFGGAQKCKWFKIQKTLSILNFL